MRVLPATKGLPLPPTYKRSPKCFKNNGLLCEESGDQLALPVGPAPWDHQDPLDRKVMMESTETWDPGECPGPRGPTDGLEQGDDQAKMDPGDSQDQWAPRGTEDLMDCLAFLVSRAVLESLAYQDPQETPDQKVDRVLRETKVIQGCQDPRVLGALLDLVVYQGLWDPLVQMGTAGRLDLRARRGCPDLQDLKEKLEKLDLLVHLVLRGLWVHQAYKVQ